MLQITSYKDPEIDKILQAVLNAVVLTVQAKGYTIVESLSSKVPVLEDSNDLGDSLGTHGAGVVFKPTDSGSPYDPAITVAHESGTPPNLVIRIGIL